MVNPILSDRLQAILNFGISSEGSEEAWRMIADKFSSITEIHFAKDRIMEIAETKNGQERTF
jgi:hypothetical protein